MMLLSILLAVILCCMARYMPLFVAKCVYIAGLSPDLFDWSIFFVLCSSHWLWSMIVMPLQGPPTQSNLSERQIAVYDPCRDSKWYGRFRFFAHKPKPGQSGSLVSCLSVKASYFSKLSLQQLWRTF